ncbi:hypothetical protein [Achromobacter animicus]|uniref:hypothetical protein n=1 Tax=Achromobacter animicus TaxID=1389935 RepID=UPI0015836C6F|nr:hypothetical protein [Achromobacter animicus]
MTNKVLPVDLENKHKVDPLPLDESFRGIISVSANQSPPTQHFPGGLHPPKLHSCLGPEHWRFPWPLAKLLQTFGCAPVVEWSTFATALGEQIESGPRRPTAAGHEQSVNSSHFTSVSHQHVEKI